MLNTNYLTNSASTSVLVYMRTYR